MLKIENICDDGCPWLDGAKDTSDQLKFIQRCSEGAAARTAFHYALLSGGRAWRTKSARPKQTARFRRKRDLGPLLGRPNEAWPISASVNSPKNNHVEIIVPVDVQSVSRAGN